MLPHDPAILAVVATPPETIFDVLRIMQSIDAICPDGDGLKWFNWLYLNVTEAVAVRVSNGGFANPSWIADLDVQFARLYFSAPQSSLSGGSPPECWQTLFSVRNQVDTARIQFAMAGINAHINHDLAQAIVTTCQTEKFAPQRNLQQYTDYTALNSTLDAMIQTAEQQLHVRLLGQSLPPVSHLDDLLAAWSVAAAREAAWNNAELLWHLQPVPSLSATFMQTLDGLTTVAGKALLVPVPCLPVES